MPTTKTTHRPLSATRRTSTWAAGGALISLGLAACAPATGTTTQAGGPAPASTSAADGSTEAQTQQTQTQHRKRTVAYAVIRNPQGKGVGTLQMQREREGMRVSVQVYGGIQPGFHGLHLHTIGECKASSPDPNDPTNVGHFNSAGGHLGSGSHPGHAGDLPSLYVDAKGKGSLTTYTDRLTRQLLHDANGTAVIIHAGPDNYANIPTRYASAGPDDATKRTGDAGARAACGVLRAR